MRLVHLTINRVYKRGKIKVGTKPFAERNIGCTYKWLKWRRHTYFWLLIS